MWGVATHHWSCLIWSPTASQQGAFVLSRHGGSAWDSPDYRFLSEPPASASGPYLQHLCFRRGRKKKVVKAISCWPAVPSQLLEAWQHDCSWSPNFEKNFSQCLEIPSTPTSTLLLHYANWDTTFNLILKPVLTLESQLNLSWSLLQPRCDVNHRLQNECRPWWQCHQRGQIHWRDIQGA